MANQQLYSVVFVTVDDALLTESGSAQMKRMTDAQVIKTMAKGFAGFSPGAPMCEIDVTNAVPSADFELDPGPYMLALKTVEIGYQIGNKTFTSKGCIIEDSFSGAVDSPSGMSFRFIGSFPEAV